MDLKRDFYVTKGLSGSVDNMEREYYAGLSGLTPKEKYTLVDHKREYFRVDLNISESVAAVFSVTDLEFKVLDPTGTFKGSLADLQYDFYTHVPAPTPLSAP